MALDSEDGASNPADRASNMCAFCREPSTVVVTVDDPCPFEDEQVIDDELAVPVCPEHLHLMKEAAI